MNPAVKDGKAEWHPFREPKPIVDVNEVKPDGESPEESTDRPDSAVESPEAAIRAMLEEYNSLALEGKTEDLLDFYVESQIDAAKALIDEQVTVAAALADVRKALESKLPDEQERIAAALELLQAFADPRIDLRSVSNASPKEALGVTPAFTDFTYRFVLVEDDWYIEIPSEKLSGLHDALKLLPGLIARWKSELESGQPEPAAVLAEIEKSAAPPSSESGKPDEPADRAVPSGG
jgi:hypothetical protein